MKLTRRGALVAGVAISAVGARAAESSNVGGVEDIVNFAWATLAPDPREEIEFEDDVYLNEEVETGEESALVIKFSDGSQLTLGENARITIDKYVYNPAGESSQIVTLTKGAFRFLSGSMPKAGVKLQTPAVTVGIRGTELIFDVGDDGATEMSTVAGEALCTDGGGETLTVGIDQSIEAGPDRRFRGKVRRFRHKTRSIAIAEGLAGARTRWRIRKVRRRRVLHRPRRRHN